MGRLIHDLHCKNAEDMYSRILADRVYELKETQEGVKLVGLLVGSVTKTPQIAKQAATRKAGGGLFNMCTAMEELEQKLKQEGMYQGENRLAHLLEMFSDAGRDYDMRKAMKDEAYRRKLYDEFGIK